MAIAQRRIDALNVVDLMPGNLRQCVHEFGLPIVTALTKHGIKNPQHIREIVREVWAGSRQEGQRADTMNAIDCLLGREALSARGLLRLLADNNRMIVSVEPTRVMLDASLAEVSGHNIRCTKEKKHRRRLRAALRAAMKEALEGLHD